MKRILVLAGIFAALLAPGLAPAQESEGADRRSSVPPPDGGEKGEDPLAKVFGEGGMELITGDDGEMTMESDPDTGELRFMHVKKNVRIKSDTINLQCDDLKIDMIKSEMVAIGPPGGFVGFSKTDLEGECTKLVYKIEEKIMSLQGAGGRRPWVRQVQTDGSIRETTADTIMMTETANGGSNISLSGGPIVKLIPAPGKAKKEGNGSKKTGEKVREGEAAKIPSPAARKPVNQN